MVYGIDIEAVYSIPTPKQARRSQKLVSSLWSKTRFWALFNFRAGLAPVQNPTATSTARSFVSCALLSLFFLDLAWIRTRTETRFLDSGWAATATGCDCAVAAHK